MATIVNMSDNEDLLADDLGDHSLADYNLGNEEEDQLLADDFEGGGPQNVPPSMSSYDVGLNTAPPEYPRAEVQYTNQRIHYHLQPDTECVVPNITVEVPIALERPSYAPYEPPQPYEIEHHVPPAIPAAPMEPPQMVPTEMSAAMTNGECPRARFTSERPAGAQRTPQHRDIPDTLDKVVVPRGGWGGGGRGRTSWRNPQYAPRYHNQYRRNNVHRGNFNPRASFPPPRNMRPNSPQMPPNMRPNSPQMPPNMRPNPPQMRPEIRPDLPPNIRADLPPNIRPDLPPNSRPDLPSNIHPDLPPNVRPELPPNIRPDLPPNIRTDLPPNIRPDLPPDGLPNPEMPIRPEFHPDLRADLPLPPGQDLLPEDLIPMEPYRPMDLRPPFPRFQYRPGMDESRQYRPGMDEPRQYRPGMDEPRQYRPGMDEARQFHPRPYDPFFRPFRPFPPMREVTPNMNHLPQVTIRHGGPMLPKQEVRMLPVQLPPVPGGLQGKKVLINPHFKGNFQPVDGPVKDIDDAAERFIAEQRNALARAATRKFAVRRSPQRYIENTTIEIENELARPPRRRSEDDDLLRRQEEFINANRAGLRRRMRSPTPPRRSASPRASPERAERPRARPDARPPAEEEDGEYRRRMREQEALRDRVMRAKEARRRKRAVAATIPPAGPPPRRPDDRDRIHSEKEKEKPKELRPVYQPEPVPKPAPKPVETEPVKPDTTRKSPDRVRERVEERERSPVRKEEEAEVNSTCEGLTPPLKPALDSDDDLDLILGDIDGILSDDDDSGRFKEKATKPEPPKPQTDLRSKLPPKTSKPTEKKPPKQRIVFGEEKQERKRKEKTPPKKTAVSSSTREEEKKSTKAKERTPPLRESKMSMRQRITFGQKAAEKAKQEKEKQKEKEKDAPKASFSNRRVILQRKVSQTDKSIFTRIEVKADPSKPNPGIFTRAVKTLGAEKSRLVLKKQDEPQIEFESDSDIDEDKLLEDDSGSLAVVTNLPHGMTDTRLKTLAGNDVQTLTLDKEDRSAKITFKSTVAAESFKKKFHNKMVAASRLAVTLR